MEENTTEVAVEEPVAEEQVEEPAEEPVVEENEPEPKKKTAQERINEITKARRDAEREAEYWRKVALEKEKQFEAPVKADNKPDRPRLEQFDTTTEYEDALFEWRDRIKSQEETTRRAQTEQEKALETFNEKARIMRDEYPDFDEIIEAPVFSPMMRSVLLQSDNGPEVAYFLGKPENSEQAKKIRNLPAERQAYEIGKLESNLLLAKKTRKVPSAPPPITPVGMSGGGKGKDPADMTTTEWMQWDKERTLEKLKAKYG